MKNEAFAPTPELLAKMDVWWRAANYLSACQLYLLDDPLLRRRLTERDIKKKIVGHWGTVPGQNFIYTHLNRVINEYDLDMIYLSGPGHGGNAMVAQDYLDGSYTDVYPNITRDAAGMQRLFKQFSFPGGIPSHVAPETPGSIHEGGELGYSLAHAFGAVMDNPDLIAACVVGDGEAETGPLATAWHGNKFVNPITDGAVLPILHLNGFKIANPTLFSRISHEELEMFFRGCGWEPRFVEGDDPAEMHAKMAETMDWAIEEIHAIQQHARTAHDTTRPYWPMIVFRAARRKWTAGRWRGRSARIRCRSRWTSPSISCSSRSGCAATIPRSSLTTTARSSPSCRRLRRRDSAAWARTPTQTAACCCASCACRTSARMSSPCRRPAPSRRRT